jgi:predicted transcriptional regulator
MAITATSLKLPAELKNRLAEIAQRSGQTAHAYMISALQERVQQDERAQRFLRDANAADKAMLRSGNGFAAADVHAYVAQLVAGRKSKRPAARNWRK